MVESYFGMRIFTAEPDSSGIPRLCLNHQPYFQKGILDQGYYPESLLTPVSDEAMIFDIETAKEKGFNMIRKHCKIEPMRWYYHCDRLGMLVWQDMINGGTTYNLIKTCYIPTVLFPLRHKRDNDYGYTSRADKMAGRSGKRSASRQSGSFTTVLRFAPGYCSTKDGGSLTRRKTPTWCARLTTRA